MNRFDERLKILKQSVKMEDVPARIPHVSNIFNWAVVDSPYTFPEVFNDPKKIVEVWIALQEKYNFDSYIFLNFFTNYVKILDPIGGTTGREIVNNGVNKKDLPCISTEEMDEYVKDPKAFMWTKLMKRRFPLLEEKGSAEKIKKGILGMLDFLEKADNTTAKLMREKYEVPVMFGGTAIITSMMSPIETLYSMYSFRGITNTAIDMRKNPNKYKEQLDTLAKWYVDPYVKSMENSEYGTNQDTVVDSFCGLLAQNIMNIKQFEMFLWPYIKKQIDALVAKDKMLHIYVEGAIMRFSEFLQDIPKGHVVLYSENDNIFELRKKLPNICLLGGMPCYLLGTGNKEACIDLTKKLIDGIGRDGGYMFSQDKMVSFPIDCKSENLKAVSETILTYGIRR